MKHSMPLGLSFIPVLPFRSLAVPLAALAFCIAGVLYAPAQTAHFSGTIKTLGGGFNSPAGVAVDGKGNILVADTGNNAVKEIPSGCVTASCVTTLGGGFNSPLGLAIDATGNVYVADGHNSAVKEIPSGCTSGGCVLTLGTSPTFETPESVAVDSTGNVYVADQGTHTVKEIFANCISASCTVTLGGGFVSPVGVAVDGSDNVYIADSNGSAVEKMPPYCSSSSCVTTLGGGFISPASVAVDASGHVFVVDSGNDTVKEIPSGCVAASCVTTVAEDFSAPIGVAADVNGNVYVADSGNNAVNEIMPRGANFGSVAVATNASPVLTLTFIFDTSGMLAATPYNVLTLGTAKEDFNASATQLSTACVTKHAYSAGNTCTVDVTFAPRFAGLRTGAVTLQGSSGTIATAYVYGIGSGPQMALLPAKMSLLGGGFGVAYGVAVDGSGNIYVVDSTKKVLNEMPPGCVTASCVTTVASGFTTPSGVAIDGSGTVYMADSGNSTVKKIPVGCAVATCMTTLGGGFKGPLGVAVDGTGNVYVADNGNSAVKEMPSSCTAANCVTTLGSGFSAPTGVAVDSNGNVYVADTANNAVKKITPGCAAASCVTTLGGGFNNPFDVAVGGTGIVYIADGHGSAVKEMSSACTTASCVVTLSTNGSYGYPQSLVVDGIGNVYVADRAKNTVSELDMTDVRSLNFPTATMEGVTDATDGAQTVTLQNIGNVSLTFPVPATGSNPSISADFTLATTGTGDCPQVTSTSTAAGVLAPGASCTLPVTFAPISMAGSGTLALTDNNLNAVAPAYATQTVPLSGTATPGTPDFTLTSRESSSQTATAGQSAMFTYSIGPTLAAYPGTVSCTVTGLPSGATATFSPASIAANGGAQTLTLTIQVPTASAAVQKNDPFSSNGLWSLAFLMLPLAGVRRTRRTAHVLLVFFVLAGLGTVIGCQGSKSPATQPAPPTQPSQSYTITVTATSGAKVHTVTSTLIVQ